MDQDLKTKLKHYRISETEYHKISELLGRPPQGVEWAIFSALWSEHCSYKSSKVHLKKFGQTLTDSVLQSQGENAGIVDLGQGEKVVFKMESHNHPSFIEPYQGAATGVGGILRDIFTMGARPIASADYLCFGEAKADRMKMLVDGVVRGISGYGNSVGVPTVTGRTQFEPEYNTNILVNAMSVGLLTGDDPVALSGAKGPGNDVVYVGAKTGKDGVHGAAMASESFDEDSESKRPNVQIGDPFFEKLLIESCLEVIKQDLVVAIQDMGAAGLTSSSFEMSAKGGLGFDMALDRVPLRDSSVGPEEILLSESQERMLLVCEPSKFDAISKIFARWGLEAARVGKVREDRIMKLTWHGETLVEIDPHIVVENAPQYERPFRVWDSPRMVAATAPISDTKIQDKFVARLADLRYASKKSIYRQYDQRVGGKTAQGAEDEVAMLRLPVSGRAMSMGVGCRASWMKRDARVGAMDAVFQPTLKMILKGAFPIGVTDCLNFGNPEKPEIMSEFVASVEGIRDASMALKIPVISGNVSFYNETQGQNIISTPACGIVGVGSTVENLTPSVLQDTGNHVLRLKIGEVRPEGTKNFSGAFDPKKMADGFVKLREMLVVHQPESNISVGDGGWLWSLAKMVSLQAGFELSETAAQNVELQASALEGGLYECLLEYTPSKAKDFKAAAEAAGFAVQDLGMVTDSGTLKAWDLRISADEFVKARETTWSKNLEA